MEHYYNREGEIKYKKARKKLKISLYVFVCIMMASLIAIFLFLPFDKLINGLITLLVMFAFGIPFYFLIFKNPALDTNKLKKEAYGEEVELTATNPIFEEIIDDYDKSENIFIKALAPKSWRMVYTDDHWGNIYITFKKGKNTIDFEFSDTQITVIFNKEDKATQYTQPLENFSNCVAVSDYVHKLRKEHFQTK